MEQLKKLIQDYQFWKTLEEYIDRIEKNKDIDFSMAIENAKALIESICKEICKAKNKELSNNKNMNSLMKTAFAALNDPLEDSMKQISTSLTNIAEHVGILRNKHGTISHGKTSDEIEKRNDGMGDFTRTFFISAVDTVSCLLINIFETQKLKKTEPKEIEYHDNEDFNTAWDEVYGDFEMGKYNYMASEILYYVDKMAYKDEVIDFKGTENA